MNRTKLKNYAPKARREFIQSVTDRSAVYGLTAEKIEPVTERGDVAIIAGRAFPRSVVAKIRALAERIRQNGFDQTMEAMAYTWFNRFVAIRFMEIHGYLEHGYRVLSNPNPEKTIPEILEHAEHIDLPGLDRNKVIDLKLSGTQDNELYRMLLIAQCNALHSAMPFLFERIDDETELLLPDNLLHSDSLLRKLVNEIEEQDWQEVEIIGWIYQFYISEKKDVVIGKVVKSEDIPAATQLFTPNWIVKYLVQNTLGRKWLATYPDSPLRQKMEYYIEPAEQTDEVMAQLAAITPTSLDPEKLTLLDDACGSGHILAEAYDLFKAIYQERGYRSKDIPRLILERNLFGLEIDDRAAQLAAFALMMKARADDRGIFAAKIQPNVLAIQESKGLEELIPQVDPVGGKAEELLLADNSLFADMHKQLPLKTPHPKNVLAPIEPCLRELIKLFEHGKTFGSLIRVPPKLAAQLPTARKSIEAMMAKGQLWEHHAATMLMPLVTQAELLARTYDAVVTNPPYMGTGYMIPVLRQFLKENYSVYNKDLFSSFFSRCRAFASTTGQLGFMSPFVWMFIEAYEELREQLIDTGTLTSLVQLEYSGFAEATVPICTFTLLNIHISGFKGSYIRLSDFRGSDQQAPRTLEAIGNPSCGWYFVVCGDDFSTVPGRPIAYWISEQMRNVFKRSTPLADIASPRKGLVTSDNARFLRMWHEVSIDTVAIGTKSHYAATSSGRKWFTYACGGDFRKWYGNTRFVINWAEGGKEIIGYAAELYGSATRQIQNVSYYFGPSICWSNVTSSQFEVREVGAGFIFGGAGSSAFPKDADFRVVEGFLNTRLASELMKAMNPTLNFVVGNVANLPVLKSVFDTLRSRISANVKVAVEISREDWSSFETSWEFETHPLLSASTFEANLSQTYRNFERVSSQRIARLREIEIENNRLFIEGYGLEGLSPEVSEDQITLDHAECRKDMNRLIAYAIGCLMGRYSLDKPGLVYAHSRNEGFDPSQYRTFPADADGIIPITELAWFPDDATERFVEFIAKAWPREHLEENLKFIADSLGPSCDEHPRDTIRRYLATGFYKDHMQTYKKRPIYWLFSSGKQKGFQCLVYLHRYHEGTLARMRTEYVIPLQGKISARIDQLASDAEKAASTSHRKRLEKERDKLVKQQAELQQFDEKLRHYADLRINLDLDDGVKINYGRFGDLLAEVKAVTGGGDE